MKAEEKKKSNPWNNRTASFAVAVAFLTGLIVSLAVRGTSPKNVDDAANAARNPTHYPATAFTWRVPVAFSTNLPALGDNILYVSDILSRASGGRIELQIFEPGKLLPPFSITEAVRDGKIEAGYTWVGYDQGRIPATPLIAAVPFGMEPWEFAGWYYEGDGKKLAEDLYREHNIHPILCSLVGPETAGWFRKKIVTVDDFKGLKIRFAGLGGKVLQKLGASVTLLPAGEIFQALEKGAIDATEFSMPAIDQKLGFYKVAKFNYFPGWHQPFTTAHLVVNGDVWRRLTEADQAIIEMACTAGVIRNLAKGEAIQGEVIEAFKREGIISLKLDDAILRRLREVTEQVLEEEAAKDESFRIIYSSQKRFQKTYRSWKELAYLARDF